MCWNLEDIYIEDVLMTCIATARFRFVQEAELRWVEAEKDLEKALEEVGQLHTWFTLQQWLQHGHLVLHSKIFKAFKPTASYILWKGGRFVWELFPFCFVFFPVFLGFIGGRKE